MFNENVVQLYSCWYVDSKNEVRELTNITWNTFKLVIISEIDVVKSIEIISVESLEILAYETKYFRETALELKTNLLGTTSGVLTFFHTLFISSNRVCTVDAI